MDFFHVDFPISGVTTWVFLPPLIAFFVSLLTSMGGVSGAFLLLPYQVSFLGFNSPSVSSTNFVYNIVAIPSGVYRYIREGRMAWPLAAIIIAGTLPGVLIGYYLRVLYLPDPRAFKLFVGCVLFCIGGHLLYETTRLSRRRNLHMKVLNDKTSPDSRPPRGIKAMHASASIPPQAVVKTLSFSLARVDYEFWRERFTFSTPRMMILAFFVGIIGGAYGIGGGSIISPLCVAFFRLPVYTVAGAALMGTFLTSIAGVFFYSVIPASGGISTAPDWLLGFLFGAGGFIGMYCGARLQKYVPQNFIKAMLGLIILFLAGSYIVQYFAG